MKVLIWADFNMCCIDQLKVVRGLFCGWALFWRDLTSLLRKKIDLAKVEGMDISRPASIINSIDLYPHSE